MLIILTGIIFFVAFNIWFKTVYIYLALITLYIEIQVKDIIVSQKSIGARTKEMAESNRMLGLSFQSQGLLDLAFEKFRKCPLDNSMKDVIYNLGLDYYHQYDARVQAVTRTDVIEAARKYIQPSRLAVAIAGP